VIRWLGVSRTEWQVPAQLHWKMKDWRTGLLENARTVMCLPINKPSAAVVRLVICWERNDDFTAVVATGKAVKRKEIKSVYPFLKLNLTNSFSELHNRRRMKISGMYTQWQNGWSTDMYSWHLWFLCTRQAVGVCQYWPWIRYICDISQVDKGLPFCSKRWVIINSFHSLDT
jgi:hypothetical protein